MFLTQNVAPVYELSLGNNHVSAKLNQAMEVRKACTLIMTKICKVCAISKGCTTGKLWVFSLSFHWYSAYCSDPLEHSAYDSAYCSSSPELLAFDTVQCRCHMEHWAHDSAFCSGPIELWACETAFWASPVAVPASNLLVIDLWQGWYTVQLSARTSHLLPASLVHVIP